MIMKCMQCGTDYQGKYCPECGTQNPSVQSTGPKARKKKPLFLRWWFILLVIIIAIAALSSIKKEQRPQISVPTVQQTYDIQTLTTTATVKPVMTTVKAEPSETDVETTIEETGVPETTTASNILRSDFKDAMDSYEAFMDEYVSFMKKYKENPSDLSLLKDYTQYMSKATDMAKSFDRWESEEMNAAETAYYMEVQLRVNKKLLEVAE